jgi:hypothetical protein
VCRYIEKKEKTTNEFVLLELLKTSKLNEEKIIIITYLLFSKEE